MLEKKCPYFYEMDELVGEQHNITPRVLMEPGRAVLAPSNPVEAVSVQAACDGTPGRHFHLHFSIQSRDGLRHAPASQARRAGQAGSLPASPTSGYACVIVGVDPAGQAASHNAQCRTKSSYANLITEQLRRPAPCDHL
jgi:hypothetical protein